MSREKESYRDNLERIISFYPGKELLTPTEVSKFLGVCPRTCKKMFEFKNNYISIAKLARGMS